MGILGGIELDMRNSGSINMNKNSKNVVLYASEDTQDYPPPQYTHSQKEVISWVARLKFSEVEVMDGYNLFSFFSLS